MRKISEIRKLVTETFGNHATIVRENLEGHYYFQVYLGPRIIGSASTPFKAYQDAQGTMTVPPDDVPATSSESTKAYRATFDGQPSALILANSVDEATDIAVKNHPTWELVSVALDASETAQQVPDHSTDSAVWIVTIEGRTWGGFNAEMEFTFRHLPTMIDVKRKAGDFESWEVSDVQRIETHIDYFVIDPSEIV
jgi:hypothetical protein